MGIMALIMGAMIPAVGVIRERAERMAVGQQMRQLGMGLVAYQDGGRRSMVAGDIWEWMLRLAEGTGIAGGGLYFVESDSALEGGVPLVVAVRGGEGWALVEGVREQAASVVVASGVPTSAPPGQTPVAWTRGLGFDGRWAVEGGERGGVFGEAGGFIVFMDGHVRWFDDLGVDGGQLMRADGGGPTADIRAALPAGVRAYDSAGQVF